jgi:hypothetical protein
MMNVESIVLRQGRQEAKSAKDFILGALGFLATLARKMTSN